MSAGSTHENEISQETTRFRCNDALYFAFRTCGESRTLQPVGRVYTDSSRTFNIDDVSVLSVLEYATSPRTRNELVDFVEREFSASSETAETTLETLIGGDFLLPADDPIFRRRSEWMERNWRRALYYHVATRDVDYIDDTPDDRYESREMALESYRTEDSPPDLFGDFEESTLVPLSEPDALPQRSLESVLLERRTVRNYSGEPMTESELSTLLAHTFAPVADVREYITKNLNDNPTLHLLSAQYPFDVFVIVGRHDTLEPGVYRYAMREHALTVVEPLSDPVEVDGLLDEISHQPYSRNSAITVLFTQNIGRERWAYRHENSLRNLYVKIAGHAQRLILAGVSMEFGAFQTPALDDSVVDALVGVDGFSNPASYLVTLGK